MEAFLVLSIGYTVIRQKAVIEELTSLEQGVAALKMTGGKRKQTNEAVKQMNINRYKTNRAVSAFR